MPIIQGGMGVGVSMCKLAAATARAGGLGVVAAVGLGYDAADKSNDYLGANIRGLRYHLREAREHAEGGALGVNIMVALSDYGSYARAAAEEGVDVIFSGAGLPMTLPEFLPEGSKTKLVPIISSHRAATLLCKKWLAKYNRLPDGFVVEGPLAGGHLGFRPELLDDPDYQLEKLIPEVVEAVKIFEDKTGTKIPVVAAGGVFTGADIAKFFTLGAAGVQLGTRFVATEECDASDAFKQAYVDSKPEDVIIIKSPVGLPGRAIKSPFTHSVAQGERKPVRCPYKCIVTCEAEESDYCIALALLNARVGNFDRGFAFAGANVHRVDKIITVQELIDSLLEEYREACQS
ncbi:MAG: nitronate monooxygenase family protein [Lentisphaeria bacterium]|nr:nitronate monooxygenase family protein [Lentisphaeria bacterium]